MNMLKALEGIGFREAEAKIYLATLELGSATASNIAKKARVKRPSAYVLLEALIKKGYISTFKKRGVTYFGAQSPKQVIESAYEKATDAKSILQDLMALAPSDLKSKPRVQYFEGHDGLVAIMEDTLQVPNKEIYAYADVELGWKTLEDYYPTYIKKKNERKIVPIVILTDNPMGRRFKEKSMEEQRSVRLVPKEKFPMSNEINIYDDKMFIISHKDMTGVIIQSEEIANTQRSIFKLAWEAAGKYDPELIML